MFVDRHSEVEFLNSLLTKARPTTGQLLLLYGRRRVGKTALLNYWAENSGANYTYWMASKEPPNLQRRSLVATIMGVEEDAAPIFDSWTRTWKWIASQFEDESERYILIIDELPYASDADPAVLSGLQQVWDQQLRNSNLIIALCGSQVNAMEAIMHNQSPLFGRLTAQWLLQPLPFYALDEFFPNWNVDEKVALYSILGGIPAYLEWLDPNLSFTANLQQTILSPSSLFMAEPNLLLYEELKDIGTYHAVLRAISRGMHTTKEISDACLIGSQKTSFYLTKLQELHFVERRLPATLTPAQRRKSRKGRYHLKDSYFRFYFRFIFPHLQSSRSVQSTVAHIRRELRPFVAIGFEQLCQEWVNVQAHQGNLSFDPEQIGSHWSKRVQIDVVAIDFAQKQILLGECKWQEDAVRLSVVRELIEEKTPKLLMDLGWNEDDWQMSYAFFSRNGFTEPSAEYASAHNMILIDLESLETGLQP